MGLAEEEEGEGEAVEVKVEEAVAMKLVALGEDEDDVSYYLPFRFSSMRRIYMPPSSVSGVTCVFLESAAFCFRFMATFDFAVLLR